MGPLSKLLVSSFVDGDGVKGASVDRGTSVERGSGDLPKGEKLKAGKFLEK